MKTEQTSDEDSLRALELDPKFAELNEYVPPLRLFNALGVARDELAHSRLLATLLDPIRFKQADSFVRAVLTLCVDADPNVRCKLAPFLGVKLGITVRRELDDIDVVVRISGGTGNAIIGIENKIGAGEQKKQIERYQNSLAKKCSTAVMVFLTPTGRPPGTACSPHSVPCVSISYEAVLNVISRVALEAQQDSDDWRVLREIAIHLEEEVMGNSPVEQRVKELWKKYPHALKRAMEFRPQLREIEALYRHLLDVEFGREELEFSQYPNNRGVREISVKLKSWCAKGFPFVFRLVADGISTPHVRVLLWGKPPHSLLLLAETVNANQSKVFDEKFQPLGSSWHRALHEENVDVNGIPEAAYLENQDFDEAMAKEAANRVVELVKQLRPHIDCSV
ncbi:MAG TPA: PD-(D/E)XK nuclease family protein [Gemmataceae bacterium]|jgi:hypothetical protein|nr:PD-(D/E)XK nuclease family protein [Gemmataceae bacterium]